MNHKHMIDFSRIQTEAQLNALLVKHDRTRNGVHASLGELYDVATLAAGALSGVEYFKADQGRNLADTNIVNARDPMGQGKVFVAEGVSLDIYRTDGKIIGAAIDSDFDELFNVIERGVLLLSVNNRRVEAIPLRHIPSVHVPEMPGTTGLIVDLPRNRAHGPRQISPIVIASGVNFAAEIQWTTGAVTTTRAYKARLVLAGQKIERV